jgi:hypothetical protein
MAEVKKVKMYAPDPPPYDLFIQKAFSNLSFDLRFNFLNESYSKSRSKRSAFFSSYTQTLCVLFPDLYAVQPRYIRYQWCIRQGLHTCHQAK